MFRFILRSIVHYRRSHFVVMLAVAVSTAVIGGALIVGDSVRASLRQMTLSRLGGITHVLHSPRFVREKLADEISETLKSAEVESLRSVHAAPAMLLPASVEKKTATGELRRAASVTVLGLRPTDWGMLDSTTSESPVKPPGDAGIVLGYKTATELGAVVGDSVSVWVELPSSIPRDSLLGEREDTTIEIVLTVEAVLQESAGASRFSLLPAQQLPYNAFVSLATFQQRLNLEERVASRRNPVSRPARVNTILIGGDQRPDPSTVKSASGLMQLMQNDVSAADELQTLVKKSISAEDIGLRFRIIEDRGYLSVESDSMILEDSIAEAVQKAAENIGMKAAPTLVYLANEINATKREDKNARFSMYSIVAGLDFAQPSPLGPILLNDGTAVPALKDDEIILSDWLAVDLGIGVGETVDARWHEVGSHGDLPETHKTFTVRGILKADDPMSVDQDLTPFVDGVTNVDSFGDWDQPFDMEMDRITSRDDEYWDAHRATPKAFVSLATAEKFWSSRFGRYTSIRVASEGNVLPKDRMEIVQTRLADETRSLLNPIKMGVGFRPIRAEGLQASVGANDFTGLFIGFSFFLILSAILLAALMFQLSVRQRVAQIGLMEAIGFTERRARRFFVMEGLAVALLGSVLGADLAVLFARLMIHGLTTWWVGAVGTQFLQLDVQPLKLLVASAISLFLSGAVIWNSVRRSTQRSPRELLSGLGSDDMEIRRRPIINALMSLGLLMSAIAAIALPVAGVAGLLPTNEAFGGLSWRVVGFFLGGFAWLSVSLLWLRHSLRRRAGDAVLGSQISSLNGLALANAARNPQRSLLTAALIAFAAFVIVAVGAGRRNPVSETPDLNSGNGGFSLVAESSQPVLFDLNSKDGQLKLGLNTSPATTLPDGTNVFGFRTKPGQDASCLNLFQATVPTLLGATPEFLQRGGFRFADTPLDQPGESAWLKLSKPLPDYAETEKSLTLPAIPVIGDMNTLQFSLKKKIGDVILFPDSQNPQYALTVAGMLDSSVFQGVLVMSDENLKRVAPETSGSAYFLIETASVESSDKAASAIETALQTYGIDTERVSQRLADFLAVQNTYLSTFQMQGGLGLLIGTFGLAAVMLRNVIERRSEIALLRSLGFLTSRIVWLVLAENSLLLVFGIASGAVSAIIAMLPHLLSTGADVPWIPLLFTLVAVLAIGTLSVLIPIWTAVRVSVREVLSTQ
jgi:ABC-type lipoprotein release transport system permease subunit